MKAWQIGFEAQGVIALRMLRLAAGGARAEAESSRMMTEKILAAGEAQVAAAAMRSHKKHVAAGKAFNVYRKRRWGCCSRYTSAKLSKQPSTHNPTRPYANANI